MNFKRKICIKTITETYVTNMFLLEKSLEDGVAIRDIVFYKKKTLSYDLAFTSNMIITKYTICTVHW